MRLGIDIDGVLYDWDRAVRNILTAEEGPPEPLTEAQKIQLGPTSLSWDHVEEVVGKRNFDWLWTAANETLMFLQEGATFVNEVAVVRELAKQHDIYLLTSRPKYAMWQTYKWLGEQRPLDVLGVIHGSSKAKVAAALGINVVVDDNPDMLRNYLLKARGQRWRKAFIYGYRQPWNRSMRPSFYRFQWIDSLSELLTEQERWAA